MEKSAYRKTVSGLPVRKAFHDESGEAVKQMT